MEETVFESLVAETEFWAGWVDVTVQAMEVFTES